MIVNIENNNIRVVPESDNELLAVELALDLGLTWERSQYSVFNRKNIENNILQYITALANERDIQIVIDRHSDFIDEGLLDSLNLVDIFSYSKELLDSESNYFDVNLRELNTVTKLVTYFYHNKTLSVDDFLVTTLNSTDEVYDSEIENSTVRISEISDEYYLKFKNIIYSNSKKYSNYAIISYWISIIEFKRGNTSKALYYTKKSQFDHIKFPFHCRRIDKTLKKINHNTGSLPATGLNDVESFNSKGEELLKNNDLNGAELFFLKALDENPKDAKVLNNLGVLYWNQQKHDQGIFYFEKALKDNPYYRDAILNLGDVLFHYKRYKDLKQLYSFYLEKFPNDTELRSKYNDLISISGLKEKKLCLVWSNCQGGSIQAMLNKSPAFTSSYNIKLYVNFRSKEPSESELASCKLFIYQKSPARFNLNWDEQIIEKLLKKLPESCLTISFPNINWNLFWPFHTKDPRNKAEEGFPDGKYPWGDSYVLEMLDQGFNKDQIFHKYLNFDFTSKVDLDELYNENIDSLVDLEMKTDIKISTSIIRNLKHIKYFNTFNHQTNELPFLIVNQILDKLNLQKITKEDIKKIEEVVANHIMPIHPFIIKHFGLEFVTTKSKYSIWGKMKSFEEYLIDYIAFKA